MPGAKGKLPAVVFVHGIGGSARVWARQIASFTAAGYTPVALDLPGYGARPPVAAMDFEDLAADVEARIAERSLHRPVLVGHSMGGMIAQTALRRRPDGYAAAVLACTSPAFGSADGAFQKKFVADRLGPLDAGKTHGRSGARHGRAHDRPGCRSGGARARDRGHERRAGGHLPRRGALPGRLRRARQPRQHRACPCFASPARRTPTRRRR